MEIVKIHYAISYTNNKIYLYKIEYELLKFNPKYSQEQGLSEYFKWYDDK